MTSPSVDDERRRRVKCAPPIFTASAPTTAGIPHPRATTAAWLTSPPRAVRMPSATCMPWTSSGEVSLRTRITFSPRSDGVDGVVGGEVHPADRGARATRASPLAITCLGAGLELRVQHLVEVVGLDALDGLRLA